MGKLKPLPKLILFLVLVGGLVMGYRHLIYSGVIPRPNALKTLIPVKAEEINAEVLGNNSNIKLVGLPSNTPTQPCMDGNTRNCIDGALHEVEIWAWNANGGFLFGVGGAPSRDGKGIQTSKGSLMEKYGVNVKVIRQDDSNQMKTDLMDTANRLKSDPNAGGIKFVTVMGDGGAQFFQDLKKACPTCNFEVAGILGYSRGEDGFWGPQEWKTDPQKARGGLVIGVLRDGDWNIAMKWAAQNGIPNNPDDTVYDPTALNWVNADSYTKAAEMLVSNYCAPLPVKGKLGSAKQQVCASAAVTWTPGDVTIAKKRGGLVPIMTTKQSIFQMPCILVGIKSWDEAHRNDVVKLLAASFEGADQIRANPAALQKMGEVSATLYKEQDAAYWVRYYKGVTEPDAQGIRVSLGGSSVANLADNLQAFGLSNGPNLFAATYNTFGKIVVQQYPKLYPEFPPVAKVLNTSYVQGVKSLNTLPTDNAEDLSVKNTAAPMKIEGRRDYSIQFASGSATILPVSYSVLDQLADEIEITKYGVALHGHTDAAKWTGLTPEQSAEKNMTLSQARASAVEAYLRKKGLTNVIRSYPHGQEEPVADNASEAGRAKNRRVQVVLGSL
jgi:outer membrane protein OmpA-like peptidoglycan-associated protein